MAPIFRWLGLADGPPVADGGHTRRWLLLPILVQVPIGDSLFTVGTATTVFLIVVAALAPDADTVAVA